ncbi:MAG: M20 metallopeptidase family protein [Inquilinaceae bacterium]
MTSAVPDLRADIDTLVKGIEDDLVRVRRHLHAHPELGFQEHETASLVAGWLSERGIERRTAIGKTGVVGLINPGGSGPTIGIRADMDALPITEQTGLDYASIHPGVMHACGHDAHTTIGLGVADVLQRCARGSDGRFLLVFQPAEEGLGGARAMLDDGLFDWVRPDRMLGFHNWPPLPAGQVGWHPTVAFSSSDLFDVEIEGVSGHGAHPHLAVDPIVAAAAFITQIQTIVSREIAPIEPVVLTVGQIQGGTARNQIPDRVVLKGSYRTQSESGRQAVGDALRRVAEGVGMAQRARCTVTFHRGVPPVVNDGQTLHTVLGTVRGAVGEDNVIEIPQGSMGSEDFAEFATRVPSAHLRIGSGLPGYDTMLHRSNFTIDERALSVGVRVLALCALDLAKSIDGTIEAG